MYHDSQGVIHFDLNQIVMCIFIGREEIDEIEEDSTEIGRQRSEK